MAASAGIVVGGGVAGAIDADDTRCCWGGEGGAADSATAVGAGGLTSVVTGGVASGGVGAATVEGVVVGGVASGSDGADDGAAVTAADGAADGAGGRGEGVPAVDDGGADSTDTLVLGGADRSGTPASSPSPKSE